ncbi:Ig-like domain-containing protein [Chloroflexota bacterium]
MGSISASRLILCYFLVGITLIGCQAEELTPTVAACFPPNDAKGIPLENDVMIRFSDTMDRDTTMQALSIYPEIEYSLSWGDNDSSIIIHPINGWGTLTEYRISVSGTACSQTGRQLGESYNLTFETEGVLPLVVSTQLPFDYKVDPLHADVRITFSTPMDKEATAKALIISPGIDYDLSWEGGDQQLIVHPLKGWEALTDYMIMITGQAKSQDGWYLKGDYTTTFSIKHLPPVVLSIDLPVDRNGVSVRTDIRITFSNPMDEGTTAEATTLSPQIANMVFWENDGRTMVIHPLTNWQILTNYKITITGMAKSNEGFFLKEDFYVSFKIKERPQPPVVVSTAPNAHEEDVQPEAIIKILFSKPMDRATTEKALVIIPNTDLSAGIEVIWEEEDCLMVICLAQNLRPGEPYYITITGAAMSADGLYLEKKFTLTFYVEDC